VTLDEVIAAEMPAGSKVWHCPLCEWVHAQPPPDGSYPVNVPSGLTLSESLSTATMMIMTAWMGEAEEAVQAHLSGHTTLEWAREVSRLQVELSAVKAVAAGRNHGREFLKSALLDAMSH
jgi:hypothetical protein